MIKLFCSFALLILSIGFAQDKPKNIILLIGDGMGINYVSTSVISMENDAFKRFESIGLSVTCAADNLITDSAAGATAIATGCKTNNGSISVDTSGNPCKTIFEIGKENGKSTGMVVTSTITHATPASFYGHVIDRDYQKIIAQQLVDSMIVDVAIGSGSNYFLPEKLGGYRDDGRNLLNDIKQNDYQLFLSSDQLLTAEPDNKFFGLLAPNELGNADERGFTLGELTEKALNVLKKNENGFILLVEGSQIDWAGHDNIEDYLLMEMEDFNTAINTSLDFAEKNGETLVIVTADHEVGGMAITGGSKDGKELELDFLTTHHTANLVGVFAKGPSEEHFRGVYDNSEIGKRLIELIVEN